MDTEVRTNGFKSVLGLKGLKALRGTVLFLRIGVGS